MSQRNFNVVEMAYRFLKRDPTMKVLATKMVCVNEAYYMKHTTYYVLPFVLNWVATEVMGWGRNCEVYNSMVRSMWAGHRHVCCEQNGDWPVQLHQEYTEGAQNM